MPQILPSRRRSRCQLARRVASIRWSDERRSNKKSGILKWTVAATGVRLAGEPGSPEFLTSFTVAEQSLRLRHSGTLSGLIRDFEGTKQWRWLAESTRKEYKRVLKFWDAEYSLCFPSGLGSFTGPSISQARLSSPVSVASTKPSRNVICTKSRDCDAQIAMSA